MDVVKGHILSRMKSHFDELTDNVHRMIIITQKKLIRNITALAFMLLGLVFVVVGGTTLLIDVYKFSRSTVFLTTGIVLMLISIILAQSAKLLKYEK